MEDITNLNLDITQPKDLVSGITNKPKITRTNWVPSPGAEAARQEIERQQRAMYEMQHEAEKMHPHVQRMNQLEERIHLLEKALTKVLAHE